LFYSPSLNGERDKIKKGASSTLSKTLINSNSLNYTMKKKKSGHKIALSVLSSIILTIIIVALVNVGLSIFLESPGYSNYCGEFKTQEIIDTQTRCQEVGGQWNPEGKTYPSRAEMPEAPEAIDGYCDRDFECRQELEEAEKSYNQIRYYIFAILGLTLLLTGIFSIIHTVQYTGLATGGILLLEGIVTNLENKILVFVSLLIILVIFGFLVLRKIEKK
jgi:hypothetical protein